MRPFKYSKELIAKARKMYKEGYDAVAIGKELNMPKQVVYYHTRPKYRKRQLVRAKQKHKK